jgi:hypothetical protein
VATPDDTNLKHAMRGMAYFHVGLGAFAWMHGWTAMSFRAAAGLNS